MTGGNQFEAIATVERQDAGAASLPDDLDAVLAAPQYHAVILENAQVRVLDTVIPCGHKVPLHTHRWPAVTYLVAWSDCVRRDRTDAVLYDSRSSGAVEEGTAFWVEPMTEHTLENVGEGDLHVITVEMKA
jgi:quercetin dioxygenase-like cupin family protein